MSRRTRSRARRSLEADETLTSNDKSGLENEEETKPKIDEINLEMKRRKLCNCEENVEKNTADASDDNAANVMINPVISNGNVLLWKFENVQELTDEGVLSEKFTFRNVDWKIQIRTLTEKSEKGVKWLSIFLLYDSKNKDEKNWICETDTAYKMLDENGTKFEKKFIGLHETRRNGWGYRKFIEFSKLVGHSIIVEIDFNFKYYDFSKNIENFTNVKLNVKDTEFHVNKGILCSNSTYFYKLFVTENSQKTKIEIDDVAVMDFLYFIASFHPLFQRKPADCELRNYEKMMELAKKYDVATLHSNCEQFLISTHKMELVKKFKYAQQYNYHDLMKYCLTSLESAQEIKELRTSVEFHSFNESTKLSIMNRLLDFS